MIPEGQVYYYKNRVYDPVIGRFLQTDPIGYSGGMNLYAYVGNDPLNLTDPTGLATGLCVTVTIPEHPEWGTSYSSDCFEVGFNDPPTHGSAGGGNPGNGAGGAGWGGSGGHTQTPQNMRRQTQRTLDCPAGSHAETRRMLTTGYDNSYQSTQKNPGDPGYGQTASGPMAQTGTIAAPRTYPFGTKMYVPSYGPGIVQDRGGAIKNAHIDLWFPSTAAALNWGAQYKDVQVCVAEN